MSERQIPVRRIPVPVRYIGEYGTGIEVVQARAPLQVPVKYAKTTVPRWYRSAKAVERWQKTKRYLAIQFFMSYSVLRPKTSVFYISPVYTISTCMILIHLDSFISFSSWRYEASRIHYYDQPFPKVKAHIDLIVSSIQEASYFDSLSSNDLL